jgi:tetratricopeptide repeat protein 8
MGGYSAEIFNNVALCCLRAQHWDLTLACFRRVLLLATETEQRASLWYNLSHVALVGYYFY